MTLFDIIKSSHIKTELPGFTYIDDFLPRVISNEIYNNLNEEKEWFNVGNRTSRQVINFGYKYSYKNKGHALQPSTPFPDYITTLKNRIENHLNLDPYFDQCIINKYLPGEGIGKHTDHTTQFDNTIVGITLGSGIEMEFRKDDTVVRKYIKPGSMYVMSDECRYKWTHEIRKKKTDIVNGKRIKRDTRISVTFRKIKKKI